MRLTHAQFSEALLVIPRTLAVNAAQDATELTAKLCAKHHRAQTVEGKAEERFMGLELIEGKVRSPVALWRGRLVCGGRC